MPALRKVGRHSFKPPIRRREYRYGEYPCIYHPDQPPRVQVRRPRALLCRQICTVDRPKPPDLLSQRSNPLRRNSPRLRRCWTNWKHLRRNHYGASAPSPVGWRHENRHSAHYRSHRPNRPPAHRARPWTGFPAVTRRPGAVSAVEPAELLAAAAGTGVLAGRRQRRWSKSQRAPLVPHSHCGWKD